VALTTSEVAADWQWLSTAAHTVAAQSPH